ncbi:MAG: non-ribosomal peptide synthetase, partial [Candidatus Angelobacter sp. Gp1-AA117]
KQLEVNPVVGGELRVRFDVEVHAFESEGRILVNWLYNRDLFERWRIEQMARHYVQMLDAVVRDPGCAAGRVEMLSAPERHQLLYGWNDTGAAFPRDKCVHELFEEQVARTPDAIAVVFEGEELSYAQLNARANRLAHYLRELGVRPDDRVAICAERGFAMLVGLLAILKAGGAYVPLDPAYPEERLQYMLEDSAPILLLTQRHLEDRFSGIGDGVPVLDLNGTAAWQSFPESNPEHTSIGLTPKHLAYVIYTSGSTGSPKGVAIEHRNAVNFVYWAQMSFSGDALESTLFSTSLNFDLAVYECFVPITVGAKVCIVPNALDLARRQVDVTLINTVPSAMKALLEVDGVPKTVRVINLAGEPLKRTLVERIFATTEASAVCNLYGPSETTTYSTWVPMKRGESLAMHIGRPIANTRVYILDGHREPVPVGVIGELYIGGAGVARGYLNRPELTAERFVADPFVGESEARMYRTGDLGRWLADGNIEFLGRNDFQVKIRGFRIELGEIEARLAEHPAVREAVVLAREDAAGEKRLVAYYTASGIGEAEAASVGEQLRAHLSAVVPDYMVPTAYVQLERIPLTPNGKIDRKSLPEPDKDIREQEYVGPRNATEETLCRLWQEVLRRERVGIYENFFNIGGHSLLAVQVISRIRQAFTVEMPLSVLFAAPTVARMAEYIAAVNEPDRSQSSPVLVSIQPQGSRAPFFCVHAVGGQVISYAELSQEMGLEQPFYGLQSPPANYLPESGVSIEQLATLYNQEIRRVQPRGPYLLSGWSMGGLVAWEMAQQLIKEGEIVRLLALIDTAPPPRYLESEDRADEISMLARFAMDMSRLVGRDPGLLAEQFLQAAEQDQWKMVQETLTSSGVLAPKTAHAEMTALLEIYTRNFRAMNHYSIQTSEQAVIYFRASETPEHFSRVWTKWSGGGIQFHSVPGDHFTMLRQPGVRIIAETLQRYLSMSSNNKSRAVSAEMSPVSWQGSKVNTQREK